MGAAGRGQRRRRTANTSESSSRTSNGGSRAAEVDAAPSLEKFAALRRGEFDVVLMRSGLCCCSEEDNDLVTCGGVRKTREGIFRFLKACLSLLRPPVGVCVFHRCDREVLRWFRELLGIPTNIEAASAAVAAAQCGGGAQQEAKSVVSVAGESAVPDFQVEILASPLPRARGGKSNTVEMVVLRRTWRALELLETEALRRLAG